MEDSAEETANYDGSPCFVDNFTTPVTSVEFREEEEEEEETQHKKKRPCSFWKRPPTKVYLDNFGFGVNGYQPMIDYLDIKDSGGSADTRDLHLPYLEERCMNKYCSSKPFKLYSNQDIDRFIDKGEKIITQIRQNDAAGANNILNRTHTAWSMTKKYVQLVKNSYVVDYRKKHPEDKYSVEDYFDNLGYNPIVTIPKKYIIQEMDTSGLLGTYIIQKTGHDDYMAQRNERLRELDNQYEETIQKLATTVDKINRREETVDRIVSPLGNIYTPDEFLRITDDLRERNRFRRLQDFHRLSRTVETLTDYPYLSRRSPRTAVQILGDEITGVNAAALALAKRNAIAAALASRKVAGLLDDDAVDSKIKEFRSHSQTIPSTTLDVSLLPPPRRRVVRESVISDVQDRVMNRARELRGVTSETRRINNRARYVNTVSLRPDTGAVDLGVRPSRQERNIVHMARSLAARGKAIRKYDIDDEFDEPVSSLGTRDIQTYCTQEKSKPVPKILSDYPRVRNAITTARFRNTILHGN